LYAKLQQKMKLSTKNLVNFSKLLIFAAEIINNNYEQLNFIAYRREILLNLKQRLSMKNFNSMSDEALALLYVEGNDKAFDELLSRTQDKLFTYIMFVVRDHDTADDIFQETFVKVITKLQEGKYTDSGKFSFWLTRIAHNVIMDWYRAQKNEHIVEPTEDNDLSNLKGLSVLDTFRENEIVNEQILSDVRKMMNALPAPQREVVYMRFYQQLSFKEIAEMTGVSINTSLGRMRYALMNLRKMAKVHNIELALQA